MGKIRNFLSYFTKIKSSDELEEFNYQKQLAREKKHASDFVGIDINYVKVPNSPQKISRFGINSTFALNISGRKTG